MRGAPCCTLLPPLANGCCRSSAASASSSDVMVVTTTHVLEGMSHISTLYPSTNFLYLLGGFHDSRISSVTAEAPGLAPDLVSSPRDVPASPNSDRVTSGWDGFSSSLAAGDSGSFEVRLPISGEAAAAAACLSCSHFLIPFRQKFFLAILFSLSYREDRTRKTSYMCGIS